ncbi:DUF2809 domain-containing protein [Cellulomonas sp. PhB143]|uniref:ribosomal maturation YjgA family protein n=1 Tax=Cellulomonas sp. PhB143 TaxID=2485186 RepID=UPI000F48314B|nr:DUF2809 domain-containing protein [Cellulomonas sp. PhB143]ROS74318.1 uncharacterized protein DUF2809 [Cellulomonas sp. PhB143]
MTTRLALLAVCVVTATAGLATRGLPEPAGDPLGDVLYAALVAVLFLLASPGTRPRSAALVALTACVALELFQLTPVPQELSGRWPASRLLLGTTFAAVDLLWYAAGAAIGALVGGAVVRLMASPGPSPVRDQT